MTSRRIMHEFRITEISAVDRPAQKHAEVVLMKRDEPLSEIERLVKEGDLDRKLRNVGLEPNNYGGYRPTVAKAIADLDAMVAKRMKDTGEGRPIAMTRVLETPAGREAYGFAYS